MYDVVHSILCLGSGYTNTACELKNYVGTTGVEVGIRKGQYVNDIRMFNETDDISELQH